MSAHDGDQPAARPSQPLEERAPLVGGPSPLRRLEIHVRHFETSLAAALATKFQATAWLLGPPLFEAAARAFVHAHPPRRPCIAEYGADFAAFVAAFRQARDLPYLREFAELEWVVGQASIATDAATLEWPAIAALGAERLLDARVALQTGLRFLRTHWSVDELLTTFLRGSEPAVFEIKQSGPCIEIRGSRGAVALGRIARAAFEFRSTLAAGGSIASAAAAALEHDDGFDAGAALRDVVGAGLVVEVHDAA
jgi:hypothetical protein